MMAHFAEINSNNIGVRVLVIDDVNAADGQNFLANTLGLGGTWVQTSYNTLGSVHYGSDQKPDNGIALRKNFAGVGYEYDPNRDAFIPIKPDCHPSEISLDEQTCQWLCADAEHLIENVTPKS